jgi:hypothetical protein
MLIEPNANQRERKIDGCALAPLGGNARLARLRLRCLVACF